MSFLANFGQLPVAKHGISFTSSSVYMFKNNAVFGQFRPDSTNFPNLFETTKRHIYTPRPLIWAYSQVSTTIRFKETDWKSSCSEIPLFLDILAELGHFRWPNLAETVKRLFHISRHFIWAYSHVFKINRFKETAWKSSCFEKPLVLDLLAKFDHFQWPKSKGTSTHRDLSSLKPSVTKTQPGKESMTGGHPIYILPDQYTSRQLRSPNKWGF